MSNATPSNRPGNERSQTGSGEPEVASEALWDRLGRCEVVDLAQELRRGMPVSPNHPPFQMALQRRHGDVRRPDGGSAANEVIVTGGHVGTHVDALAHVSHEGRLHGGVDAAAVTDDHGFARLGIDEMAPFVGRAVMLDVAALHGVDVLPAGHEVTPEELEAAAASSGAWPQPGDAALIRTGWAAHWADPAVFVGADTGAPGPGEPGARWLVDRGVALTGAETIAYECIRPGAGHATLPVHRLLLVEHGIHLVEVMNLTQLSARNAAVVGFVLAPLKLAGATGSPVRPLALLDDGSGPAAASASQISPGGSGGAG